MPTDPIGRFAVITCRPCAKEPPRVALAIAVKTRVSNPPTQTRLTSISRGVFARVCGGENKLRPPCLPDDAQGIVVSHVMPSWRLSHCENAG